MYYELYVTFSLHIKRVKYTHVLVVFVCHVTTTMHVMVGCTYQLSVKTSVLCHMSIIAPGNVILMS